MFNIKAEAQIPKLFGHWEKSCEKLKSQFTDLTDADLILEEGKENNLISRLELRLNKNRDEVIVLIKEAQTEGY